MTVYDFVFSNLLIFRVLLFTEEIQVNPQRDQAAFCNPPLGELQKKAHVFMIAVASSPPSSGFSLDDVVQSYAIYDWTTPSTGKKMMENRRMVGRRDERRRELH